jgi:16S rRNA processing protein RimM
VERLALGRVARAHGIRGRVLIAPYDEGSEGLARVTRIWLSKDGVEREIEIDRAERANLGWLVALRGISGRDQADALRGSEVLALRAELPPPGEHEVYAVDLIGLRVFDLEGAERGEIDAIESAGPQELLRLKGGALVPMGLVRDIDVERKRVVVDAPEGLFELEP